MPLCTSQAAFPELQHWIVAGTIFADHSDVTVDQSWPLSCWMNLTLNQLQFDGQRQIGWPLIKVNVCAASKESSHSWDIMFTRMGGTDNPKNKKLYEGTLLHKQEIELFLNCLKYVLKKMFTIQLLCLLTTHSISGLRWRCCDKMHSAYVYSSLVLLLIYLKT